MSALARLLHGRGIFVKGSDEREGRYTCLLRELGIPVTIGIEEDVEADLVVYTGAIAETHPQRRQAEDKGILCVERSVLLGEIASTYPELVSVAGCHGKTTTACMLSHIFRSAKRRFTAHIGGEDLSFGNFFSTGDDIFLTEACEFRRSFLSLHGGTAVILNCDLDHTDCYASQEELAEAYRTFSAQANRAVVNAEDPVARTLPHALSFGLHAGDIRAERIRSDGERYSFTVSERDIPVARIRLKAVGRVHIYNALAAFATARLCGCSTEEIVRGLQEFRGVGRRFERVGTLCGVPVICDYAHHPREISATLKTAMRLCEGRVHVVFQPHTFTRTRDFMDGFVQALLPAEELLIYATYAARESFDFEGSAAALAARLPQAGYVQSPSQLKARLVPTLCEEDTVLVLGAGDIYEVVKSILDE